MEVVIDVSKDQKEVDELLTFARRGESGDGTLGKNLCGWEELDPKFEVASIFECSFLSCVDAGYRL